MSEQKQAARILLVEDNLENLEVAKSILKEEGYQLHIARDGKQALQVCEKTLPDLILLDVLMPEMDGFECCVRLKENKATRDIPIIFLTVLTNTTNILKGFELGAVDYVGKPFNARELLARVDTHLRLRRLQVTLENNYQSLARMVEMRDNLVHMAVHDMRSPLTCVKSNLDLADEIASEGDHSEEFADILQDAAAAADTTIRMLSDLLDINRMEENKLKLNPEEGGLTEILQDAVSILAPLARDNEVTVEVAEDSTSLRCDRELLRRVLINLVENAIKHSSPKGTVRVTSEATADEVTVRVIDTGPGVPKEFQESIFEKFGQVAARSNPGVHSTGLGLTFARLAVETHSGRIGVDSDGAHGSCFWFAIPLQGPDEA